MNIDIKSCTYSLYYYYIGGSYIPTIVINLPINQTDVPAEENINIVTNNGIQITANDIGFSHNLPIWCIGRGESGLYYSFYDVYEDDNILYSSTQGYFYDGTIGMIKNASGTGHVFSASFTIQTNDENSFSGFLFTCYKYKNGDYLSNTENYLFSDNSYANTTYVSVVKTPKQGSKGLVKISGDTPLCTNVNDLSTAVNTSINESIKKWISVNKPIDVNDPNGNSGNSSGGGGGGPSDIGGDSHNGGTTPTISPINSGLITAYTPTVDELQQLGKFLWSDAFSVDTFKKLFGDPFDTLLGLSIIPIKPITSNRQNIVFGNIDSGITSDVIKSQWVDVECGDFEFNQVWNGALDYAPYTQVSIYLPFIGVKQLNVNDVMGSTLTLKYHFDVLTGGCVAEIFINHTGQGNKQNGFSYNTDMGCVYSFSGQCSVNIPLSSLDYTNSIRAMISAVGMVAGAAATCASGNPALGGAMLAVGATNETIQANTPTVERSGSLGSSSAFLSSLQPCLIVSRPHICKPSYYYELRGVPSQVYVSSLNKCTGFFQIADLQNIKCNGATDNELTEIKNLLLQGVYVGSWTLDKDLPITDGLDIELYNNSSAKNQIDKTLSGIRSGSNKLEGNFRDSCDLENPVIQIRINDVSDLNHCNYMYIGRFQRYYYITKITSLRNNIVEITGHVDVLTTYSHQIGENSAILARSSQVNSSGYGNTYLDDAQLATYQDTYNVCYNWGYSFSHENDSLVLAIAGALN